MWFFVFHFQGAINLLLALYKKEFRILGGYLTNGSKVILVNAFSIYIPITNNDPETFLSDNLTLGYSWMFCFISF